MKNALMLVHSRQRRISLALCVVTGFLVLFWAITFWNINRSLQVEIESKSQLLEGMQRRGGSGKRGADAAKFAVIAAPSETVAASRLQQYLLDRLEQAGGSVQRVQAQTGRDGRDAKSDGMRRITAEIVFDASNDALQHLLFDLETGTPFVFVDTLSTKPVSASETAKEEMNPEVLRNSLIVSSYWSSQKAVVPK
jgi:general secretion pathway protein M